MPGRCQAGRTHHLLLAAIATLAAAQVLGGVVNTVANVNQWSLRQAVTPDRLQGRVTASHRFLVYGVPPLGALLGGSLGTAIGLDAAILLCALGALLGPLWLVFSQLRRLREQPTVDDGAVTTREWPIHRGQLAPVLMCRWPATRHQTGSKLTPDGGGRRCA